METPLQGTVWSNRHKLALLAVLTLVSPTLRAEDNTLTVIDGVTVTTNGPVTIGRTGTNNSLLLTNAGQLFSTEGIIGWTNTAHRNIAVVTGAGTIWSNSGALSVGEAGSSNLLMISNGGKVFSADGYIGRVATSGSDRSSNNTVIVTGAGSLWDAGTELRVGRSGGLNNRLTILNGGRVTNGYALISGTGNSATVDGTGSRWDLSGRLNLVGSRGTLSVSGGGRISADQLWIGSSNASTRTDGLQMTVQGANSMVAVADSLEVGRRGSSHWLVVSNGATLVTGSATIGSGLSTASVLLMSDSNLVTVTGVGSVWSNQGSLRIGARGGTNFLIVSNGARAYSGSTQIGAQPFSGVSPVPPSGPNGNGVIVTGAGTYWDGGNSLFIGSFGRGNRLEILDGATATNAGVVMGGNAGSTDNRATVSGLDSTWDVSGDLWVGRFAGSQRVTVTNGAMLRTEHAFIGNADWLTNSLGSGQSGETGNNQVAVGGSNATWINRGTLMIGSTNALTGPIFGGGNNRLDIDADGRVVTSALIMNAKASSLSERIGLTGGALEVTNASGTGLLQLGVRSRVDVTAGTVRVDRYEATTASGALIVASNLWVGGQPTLSSGDMLARHVSSVGSLFANKLVVGPDVGSAGQVLLGRPTAISPPVTNRVINTDDNALTIIGDQGQGSLAIANTHMLVNELSVGRSVGGSGGILVEGPQGYLRATAGMFVGSNGVTAGTGSIIVSNGATLRTETLLVGSNGTGGVTNSGGRFQFGTNAPLIEGPGIVGYDATIDFTNVANAFLQRDQLPGVTNIQFFGTTTYELSRSTNATPEFLELRTNSAAHYQRVSLRGNSLLQTTGLLLNPGTALASPTNGAASVSGLVTNLGRFTGHASTLTFLDAVEFGPGATVDGTNVTFAFSTDLLVRDSLLTVTPGVTFETSGIALDNGTLVSSGALQFTNLSPSIPASGVHSSNGILSFRNLTDVPLERTGEIARIAVVGSLDFRLNNATNQFVSNYVFQAANSPAGYTGLRLDGGTTRWQSGGLTIGPGGLLWVSNTTPTIAIDDATLRIDNGQVIHAVNGSYNVGYADVPGAATIVTGSNALWRQAGTLYVGWTNGSQVLTVSNGATVNALGSLIAGGTSNSHRNSVIVAGSGANLAAQSITIGANNSFNELLIRDGGSITQSSTSAFVVGDGGSSSNTVRILGGGQLHTFASVATIGDVANANSAVIRGAGSIWEHPGELRIGWGNANVVRVEDGGRLLTGSAYVDYSGSSNLAVVSGIGSLWSNQTTLLVGRSGVDNQLRIEKGGMVISSNLSISSAVTASNNVLVVDGGFLLLSNALNQGALEITPLPSGTKNGRVDLRRGLITADQLYSPNVLYGSMMFSGGILSVAESLYAHTNGLLVGDATNAARLHLRGGTHTFSGGLTLNEHAALTGSGTVLAGVTNRGTLTPGDSAGALILQSNLSLAASARMSFEIGGLLAGSQHDFVAVSNLVEFAGTLSLALLNGFTPAPSDAFTLMTYGARTGAFANAADGARVNTANNLGSFHVSYSGNALTVSAYQSTDADADGIEDAWAVTYFGASPLANGTGPSEKFGDLDGDGQSNHAEFVAGTNPTDALDVFGVTELLPRADGAVRVRFRHLPGKTQRLWVSPDLVDWTEVVGPWLSFPAANTAEWLDDGVQVGVLPTDPVVSQRYYRVTVE